MDGSQRRSSLLALRVGRPYSAYAGRRIVFYRQGGRHYGPWLRALPMELVTGEAVSAGSENGHRNLVNHSRRPRDRHLSLRIGGKHIGSEALTATESQPTNDPVLGMVCR